MGGKSSIALLFFMLLLCSSASASLLVNVSPNDPGKQVLSLYLDESDDYEITVLNENLETAKNVLLKVSTVPGLKVIESGVEKSAVSFAFESMQPGEKKSILVKLKPTELTSKRLFLYVDYGVGEYTHLSATYLTVGENPLQISASLSKTALDVDEEGSIKLSLKNNGSEAIRNIKASLLVFSGVQSSDGPVELLSLAPGEGYEAKEFVFKADAGVTGKIPLVIQVSFEDLLGKHVIEKNFSVEIQSRQTVLYLIIIVIILLVAVAILSRKKQPKKAQKLEKPIVQELEGSKVKPAKK